MPWIRSHSNMSIHHSFRIFCLAAKSWLLWDKISDLTSIKYFYVILCNLFPGFQGTAIGRKLNLNFDSTKFLYDNIDSFFPYFCFNALHCVAKRLGKLTLLYYNRP